MNLNSRMSQSEELAVSRSMQFPIVRFEILVVYLVKGPVQTLAFAHDVIQIFHKTLVAGRVYHTLPKGRVGIIAEDFLNRSFMPGHWYLQSVELLLVVHCE